MTPEQQNDFKPMQEKIKALVRGQVGTTQGFPLDLWQDLGRKNLMGIVIPEKHGGLGLGLSRLALVTEELVISGVTMGFALSFLIHNLVAHHFILTHGTRELRNAYLPGLARGSITASVAVSEPGTGAHPKHLKTRARQQDDRVIIDGEKSFITNGPLADLFVVIAVTGKRENRNLFSAFVVPRDTPGLVPGVPMDLPMLRPCPHNTLGLNGCTIHGTAITGEVDRAYETMVIPFRRLEQALGPVILSGGIRHRANALAADLKGLVPASDLETIAALALRTSLVAHKDVESYEKAKDPAHPLITAKKFYRCAMEFQEHALQLTQEKKLAPSREADMFDNDLNALLRLFPG
ncbi:MAG: acyl-CoA dehydrogenase family protein [Desulfobacterium sp.]|nr:acyl-CoA dehydrogenase family protein [Desulfobacterium sp.]